MTTFGRDAKALELPWRFTGREDELELVRRSLTAGHHGIVVTGPAGCGKTRLVTETVRGGDHTRVAGTPDTRHHPFAAFAPLLSETVSLHRAVQLLSGVRLLLIDDAHLLDDASAALVHQLAVHGPTRLIVVAADGVPCPVPSPACGRESCCRASPWNRCPARTPNSCSRRASAPSRSRSPSTACTAYARLGASDRAALPWLMEPDAQPA